MPPGPPAHGCGARVFVALFLTVWCSVTFGFDAVIGWALAQQCRAYTFETTTATITRSEIEHGHDSDGDSTYRLRIGYAYSVAGQAHTGDRYRYMNMGTNDRSWHRIQAELPVGKVVPVYYDAGNPADAVLVRGPQGSDLFLLWFLTPFNVIAVGGLIYLVRGTRPGFVPDDPRVIARTEAGWQFRPGGRDRGVIFGGTLLVVAFVGVFLIGFTLGFNPPLAVMAAAWAAALVLAAYAAVRYSRRPVLEVDDLQRTVTVHPRRSEPVTIPLADVKGFSVETEEKIDSEGDRTTLYHVTLRWGEPRQSARFSEWSEETTAATVANWLEAPLKAPPGDPASLG